MPDWVSGPPVGPEALAVAMGQHATSPGGAKEIYVDSGVLRAQYENGMPPDPGTYQAEYTDVSAPPPQPAPVGEPMLLPPEVLEAMKNGKPPPAHLMPSLVGPAPGMPSLPPPPPREQVRILPGPLTPAAVEMVIPVGNGITARVSFDSAPQPFHYGKLIRHLEIEAEVHVDERRKQRIPVESRAAGDGENDGNGGAVLRKPRKRRNATHPPVAD